MIAQINDKTTSYRLMASFILAAFMTLRLQGCDQIKNTEDSQSSQNSQSAQKLETLPPLKESITIHHELGDTVIKHRPQRVAVLDMNEADFLDQLGVPIAGMVKDFVPSFLAQYKEDNNIEDLGAIVQPNIERIYALQPDLILITSLQASNYKELTQIAPTLHFDINYQNSEQGHIAQVREHLLTLGRIFAKETLAEQKVKELDDKVASVRQLTKDRPEKALVILHNNGSFSNFGVKSRYGFVFDGLGVKPASRVAKTSLHGDPISSEFIQQADPDIIYIVDRTAVMEQRPTLTLDDISNPLLRHTKAWRSGRVILVNAEAWYIMAASPHSIDIIIDDVIKGYKS